MNLLLLDVSMRNIGACLFVNDEPYQLFYLDNSKVKEKTKYATVKMCFYLAIDFIHQIPKHNIDAIVIESPTGSQSFNSALNFAFEACFFAYMQRLGYWCYNIPPTKGKLLTGSKNASKKDIIKYCQENYPDLNYIKDKKGRLLNKNEHCCDALVNGLAFIKDYQ